MRRGRSKALLALALFTPAVAAQTGAAAGSVRLQRVPPFDHWCVAPVCQSNDERPHPALLRLPSAVLPEASDGLLEQELKARLATAVDGQARALDVWSKPVADLSDSVIAALASQRQKFANSFGLTGAVLRAGLVLETASAIPAHADCAGSQRLDAIYEGLAISVALAPLHFPNASGTLNASCVETARDAELLVDRRALRALVPANVAQAVARAITKIKAADAACRPLLSQGSAEGDANAPSARAIAALPEHASVAELVTYWNGLQQLRTPELPQNAPACAAALGGPEAIPLPELSPLGDLGLMQTEAELLASALTASAALTQARSEVEARVEQLLQSGTVTKEALQALLERILRDLKPHALSADVWSHVMDALRAASVVDAMGQASVDPSVLVQTLKEAYGLDEHGVPTLRTLLGFKPTPWVAEANAGVPSLSSNDFRVIGDARLGYQGKHLGFVAHGGIKEFDIDQADVVTQDAHYFGGADGSLLLGSPGDKLRAELRAGTLLDYVDTTIIARPGAAGGLSFQDYDSLLIRAGAQLGLRFAPNERWLTRISAATSYQYETHDSTSVFKNQSFESISTTSARWGGGALIAYRFWPGVLGARARGDLDFYRLTIDRLTFDFVGQPTLEHPQASQLELSGRLFLDLDVASFVGFVPAVFGGLDYLARSGAGPDVATSTPSLGLGLMRRSD